MGSMGSADESVWAYRNLLALSRLVQSITGGTNVTIGGTAQEPIINVPTLVASVTAGTGGVTLGGTATAPVINVPTAVTSVTAGAGVVVSGTTAVTVGTYPIVSVTPNATQSAVASQTNPATYILAVSGTLAAGTYFVSGNFRAQAFPAPVTSFTTGDQFVITVNELSTTTTFLSGYSNNPFQQVNAAVSGVIVLSSPGTITWSVLAGVSSAKNVLMTSVFYQRLS